jgi:hypothetical protein
VIGIGVLLAAALYFKLAMGKSQWVSHYGFDIVAIIGLVSIPATPSAANVNKWNVWTVSGGFLIAAVKFVLFFGVVFSASLPGSEWVDSSAITVVLFFPVVAAVILLVRLPKAFPTLCWTTLISFLLFAIGLQIIMRQTLETQIGATIAKGGCVLAGRENKKVVHSAKQVNFGWFISPRSDQIYFVEGSIYFKWSYSKFGFESRRGEPHGFPVTSDLNCKT